MCEIGEYEKQEIAKKEQGSDQEGEEEAYESRNTKEKGKSTVPEG